MHIELVMQTGEFLHIFRPVNIRKTNGFEELAITARLIN
jgi:hypothetical protein